MFDIIIIGAGPVGLYSAYLCEKLGYKVVVLEEDKIIGKPLRCSGLISKNIEKFFPDIKTWNVVENEIDTAILHSSKCEFRLSKNKAAYVINRFKFDKKISEMVNSPIKTGQKAVKIERSKYVEILTNKDKFRGEMVLFCDGPNGLSSKLIEKKRNVKGLFAIVKERNNANYVELYFNKKFLNDGFFWKIPRGESVEYGGWGSDVNFRYIEKFLGIKNYEKFAGLIPVYPVKKSYGERFLLIGGAAGQNKPWSGGGVIYGLTCAEIASKIVEKAFHFNYFSEILLKEYEVEWKKKIGKQIKLGLLFRKFLRFSNDFELNLLFALAKFFDYRWMDMDFIV